MSRENGTQYRVLKKYGIAKRNVNGSKTIRMGFSISGVKRKNAQH